MQKLTFVISICLLSVTIYAQPNLYENPDFDKISKAHHIIAIVPFKTIASTSASQTKDISSKQITGMGNSGSESVQRAMYSWFLKKQQRGKLRVQVQDINTTNALLKKYNINLDNMNEHRPKEIAEKLGVDALISGNFEISNPASEETTTTLGRLVSSRAKTIRATLNLFIHNGIDDQLLINYKKMVGGAMDSSTEELIYFIMQTAPRRVSYLKN
ncbi:MAG TPA: hypothetical protein VKA27_18870 [Sunxiuqinia sp.]|nr:hypothetical protein [Sunxiuqinia sp.]